MGRAIPVLPKEKTQLCRTEPPENTECNGNYSHANNHLRYDGCRCCDLQTAGRHCVAAMITGNCRSFHCACMNAISDYGHSVRNVLRSFDNTYRASGFIDGLVNILRKRSFALLGDAFLIE